MVEKKEDDRQNDDATKHRSLVEEWSAQGTHTTEVGRRSYQLVSHDLHAAYGGKETAVLL